LGIAGLAFCQQLAEGFQGVGRLEEGTGLARVGEALPEFFEGNIQPDDNAVVQIGPILIPHDNTTPRCHDQAGMATHFR